MPWKSEIDRMVNRVILDAARGGEGELVRAVRTLDDLLELAPDRPESHFHLGTADEALPAAAAEFEDSEEAGARWRLLGRLEAAARRGDRDRVDELMDDDAFAESVEQPEGRVALRSVGRMLLRGGQDERVFGLYVRHLAAHEDEGSRRDAEFLLEEALRRADRFDRDAENDPLERLARAAAFVTDAGLESRAGAKVDRKMGRLHQLRERWDDAAACYANALERLPEDDPYRSVLVGDLALATLGVRGTLDLLPDEERESRDEAIEILTNQSTQGEGRSYNAIYTLGVLHYEQGDFEQAERCFAEADELMRQNRAKARIVHARSRFFHAHCLLQRDVDDEALEHVRRAVQKDAGPANLDPDVKETVFDALLEVDPDARIPGRRKPRRERRPREEREEGGALAGGAAEHLEGALECIAGDPLRALEFVDQAFKSRPDFETWFGAYRVRLDALIALNEREEALRTYERLRAKLYQRNTLSHIEALLEDAESPVASLFDDRHRLQEIVDLYEIMPDRAEAFIEVCRTCAQAHLDAGGEDNLSKALCLAREAAEADPEGAAALLEAVVAAASEAGLTTECPGEDEGRAHIEALGEAPHVLLVGGDEGRRPHLEALRALGERVGFHGDWVFTGARPPQKTLAEIEDSAQDASVIVLHHGTSADLRDEVKQMAAEMEIPVREVPWMGRHSITTEVLRSLIEDIEA